MGFCFARSNEVDVVLPHGILYDTASYLEDTFQLIRKLTVPFNLVLKKAGRQ